MARLSPARPPKGGLLETPTATRRTNHRARKPANHRARKPAILPLIYFACYAHVTPTPPRRLCPPGYWAFRVSEEGEFFPQSILQVTPKLRTSYAQVTVQVTRASYATNLQHFS